MTTKVTDDPYVEFRIREWGIDKQSHRMQRSVRRVLNELSVESLLRLKDPKLEVMVLDEADLERAYEAIRALVIRDLKSLPNPVRWQDACQCWLERHPGIVIGHCVWAYFPVHRRRYIARLMSPKPESRILLVFGAPSIEKEPRRFFEDCLRDHLGHVLLYLHSPTAKNECGNAMREWIRSVIARR